MSFIRDEDHPRSVSYAAVFVTFAAVLLGRCGPVSPAVSPPIPEKPIGIHLCRADVDIRINAPGLPAAGLTHRTDETGGWDVNVPVTVTAFNLFLNGNGYPPFAQVVTGGGPDFFLPDCQPAFQRDTVLQAWARPLDTQERGRVRVDGERFVREDGSTFQWRGLTAFTLYLQWLEGGAGAIDPVLANWLTCGSGCPSGPNVVRVLGMVDSFAHLHPAEHGDRYYAELRPFADYLWAAYHLRIEFVIFADAQIIMPDRLVELQHAQKVLAALQDAPNVFLEIANEPFKNIPDGGQRAYDIGRLVQNHGPPVASGDYDDAAPAAFALDYLTLHTDRGPEWPRKAKDLLDYRDVVHRPVVGDEPMGFAEMDRPGARSTSASDAADFAAACALFSAGCTFHSDAGIAFGAFGPFQAAAAAAFFQALTFIPADAQRAPYERGGTDPGCHWVGGESLVEHDDARELRSFGKVIGSNAYVVQIRTARPAPAPCAGWRVVETPRAGLMRLAR